MTLHRRLVLDISLPLPRPVVHIVCLTGRALPVTTVITLPEPSPILPHLVPDIPSLCGIIHTPGPGDLPVWMVSSSRLIIRRSLRIYGKTSTHRERIQ